MKNVDTPALQTELAYFQENRVDLIARHHGRFILVKGRTLAGVFDTPEDAYEAGVSAFGTESFPKRQVELVEPVVDVPGLYAGLTAADC